MPVAAIPVKRMDARSNQLCVRPPDSGRTLVRVRGWRPGVSCICAALLSSWLPAGCGTTVKDAFTAPPEVTVAVVLSDCSSGALGGLGAMDSDRSGNGEPDMAKVKRLTVDQSLCVLP